MAPDLRPRILATEEVIRRYVRRTPVVTLAGEEVGLPGVAFTLKLELLQHSGSFKARGAFANLTLRRVPRAGVVAASGGNHGVAVAYAAHRLGLPAKIFVPRIASPAKIDRIRGYGADLVVGGDSYAEALSASEAWMSPMLWLSTPSIRRRPSSARGRWRSSSRPRRRSSTPCWQGLAGAGCSPASPAGTAPGCGWWESSRRERPR